MAATVKSSMDATGINQLRFISLRFPIFKKLSSLRSSCSPAINNTPTERFSAFGALPVCLDQESKSMQRSRLKQPKPTAPIPFRAAYLSDRDDPASRTVLLSRLDEDWQESDECQCACRPTSPDPSPRRRTESGKCATKTIFCHLPTQLALTTLLRRGDAVLSRGRDLLSASSCRTWDPDGPRTENGSVDAQREWAGVSGLRKQVVFSYSPISSHQGDECIENSCSS